MDGLLLLLKKGRRREFLDDFVLWILLSFHYSIFIVFTPNAKQQQKRKENEERRRFREVEIGGAPSRRLSKVPLFYLLGKQKKGTCALLLLLLYSNNCIFQRLASLHNSNGPRRKKKSPRVIINAVVFARVVQTVLSAVSLYRLLALRYSSREKKPIVLGEKIYTSIC